MGRKVGRAKYKAFDPHSTNHELRRVYFSDAGPAKKGQYRRGQMDKLDPNASGTSGKTKSGNARKGARNLKPEDKVELRLPRGMRRIVESQRRHKLKAQRRHENQQNRRRNENGKTKASKKSEKKQDEISDRLPGESWDEFQRRLQKETRAVLIKHTREARALTVRAKRQKLKEKQLKKQQLKLDEQQRDAADEIEVERPEFGDSAKAALDAQELVKQIDVFQGIAKKRANTQRYSDIAEML
ncbi:MAG: hypothetical protein MHM6MM_000085 [Cercozoa sp. M6MM]